MNRIDLPIKNCKLLLEVTDTEVKVEMSGKADDIGVMLALAAATSDVFFSVITQTADILRTDEAQEKMKELFNDINDITENKDSV